jgi:Mg-chelatase subunit ChlD
MVPWTLFAESSEVAEERLEMDVVFCLDSTGSMGGEIQAAKEKIWEIANDILQGEPRPIVRFGVVTYRDKGDEYVVKKSPLTDDIDAVHEFLMSIQANGGGDGPEDVREALRCSVEEMDWKKSKQSVKVVFLVGDAPPHQDYSDRPACSETASAAVAKGININTIACGSMGGTGEAVWREIAELSDGDFQRLQRQSGAVYALSESIAASAPAAASDCEATSADDFAAKITSSLKRKAEARGVSFEK